MASWEKDLHEGSFQTNGVSSTKYDGAAIQSLIDGTPDTLAGMGAAITAFIAKYGIAHPVNTSLPLRSVTATPFANNKARATGRYYRIGANGGLDPTVYGTAAPYVEVRMISMPKYDFIGDDGLTYGSENTAEKFRRATVEYPMIHMEIPVTLTTSAIATTGTVTGRVNSDAVSYGGLAWPAQTIRYNGLAQRVRDVNGTRYFDTTYDFDILIATTVSAAGTVNTGWFRERPPLTSKSTYSVAMYPGPVTFNGRFPSL